MPCSKAVTFPCSIETMNRETYPHPSIHPLLLNPRKTELTKYYCLRFLKLLEGSNERVLSAFNQSLQSLPFPHPLGLRHKARGARGQSEWLMQKPIHDSKFPLFSNTDPLSLRHTGWLFYFIFFSLDYICWGKNKKGHLRLRSKIHCS